MTTDLRLPSPPARIHFVGIGGIGMSGLARILHAWGYAVTGTDASQSDQTDALTAEGIAVTIGHGADLTGAALLVMTAAARPDNPEVLSANAAGVPVIKRAALLGMLANARRCVAVAGSHGKSTTSGMLVTALTALQADPSYAVGAVVAATGTNAAPGAGPEMVVEADEYDRSFHTLHPDVAIVTNVDFDHPDIYADRDDYDASFRHFLDNMRPGATAVIAGDDAGCRRVLAGWDAPAGRTVLTFGETPGCDYRLAGDEAIAPNGRRFDFRLTVPGRHNQRNALASLAALVALGYDPEQAAAGLRGFRGVGRRFELKGEVDGVVVVDDYAHHPSEIAATLQAARSRYPECRIWALFQPHTYSRTKALMAEFGAALPGGPTTLVLDIYPSRETDSLGVDSSQMIALIAGARPGGTPAQAAAIVAAEARAGDLVLTMGAGDITAVGPQVLALLEARRRGGGVA